MDQSVTVKLFLACAIGFDQTRKPFNHEFPFQQITV